MCVCVCVCVCVVDLCGLYTQEFGSSLVSHFCRSNYVCVCPSTSTVRACLCVSMFLLCFWCIDSIYHILDISEYINWPFVEAVPGRLVISSSEETLFRSLSRSQICFSKQKLLQKFSTHLCCRRSSCMNILFSFEPVHNNLCPVIHC